MTEPDIETEYNDIIAATEAYHKRVEDTFRQGPDDFAAKTAKVREIDLFVMLKELYGTVVHLSDRATQVEKVIFDAQTMLDEGKELLNEFKAPDGSLDISKVMAKVMGGGKGGLLGGMF